MDPHSLPVYTQKSLILDAIKDNQVIVVESPTGSGKTTQLPLILHEAGYSENGVIGVTQPRRIAALSVSEYIAKQLDLALPDVVGYKMRFEDFTTKSTKIKIMTDGILLQEMKADYTLSNYSMIMVDEAHERSLNIDFILGLLKRVLSLRKDFKVIISSATINAMVFSEYFGNAPIVRIETSPYPVETLYEVPNEELGRDAVLYKISEIVERIIKDRRKGDILIFLPGEKAIKDCLAMLQNTSVKKKLYLLPLYGRLSREEQEMVFPPPPRGKVKVVISTNIAETSVTIDGITTVIDSGAAKLNYYNPRTFTSSLVETQISKASANQRKGRAGRTQPGTCHRLYSPQDFENRTAFTTEEIFRTDLSEVVLRMAELGITEFDSFDFISPPGKQGIIGAVETLKLLNALNENNTLSEIGKMMAEFPLLPRHSRMIVEAIHKYPQVLNEVLTATSFLTTNTPFLLPLGEEIEARKAHHTFRDKNGDFISYLKLLQAYSRARNKERFCNRYYLDEKTMAEIANIHDQLSQIVSDLNIPILGGGAYKDFLCAISRGLIQFVCVRSARGQYSSLTAEKVQIHPGSVLFRENPEFIVAGEIVKTTRMYARSVSALKREWLNEISFDLENQLQGSAKSSGKRKDNIKDSTWSITIGGRKFSLKKQKGNKKLAVLQWRELYRAVTKQDEELPASQLAIKGKLLFNKFEAMAGDRLGALIHTVKHINPDKDFVGSWPRRKNYTVVTDKEALIVDLQYLLKLTPIKRKSKTLGFLALESDGEGTFWLKCLRNFQQAVTTNLATLEELADKIEEIQDQQLIERVNQLYRKLALILDTE